MVSITGILRRFGPLGKRIAWNREFRNGAHFSGSRSAALLGLIRDRCDGKRIVELACGDGSLACAIQDYGWAAYDGFDIAAEAVAQAQAYSRSDMRFHVQDMEGWKPSEPFDLLIIEEALYYLSAAAQRELLDRAFAAITPEGAAILALHSRTKFRSIIERLRAVYGLETEVYEGERCYLVLSSTAGESRTAS
jgi:trans-aconitate methyltransferase